MEEEEERARSPTRDTAVVAGETNHRRMLVPALPGQASHVS